jgi:hypothetical protein
MTVLSYVLLAGVIGWSLYRQLQVHPVTGASLVRLPIILGIVGAVVAGSSLFGLLRPPLLPFTLLSLIVGVAAGILRGFQVRTWQQAAQWFTQGTWLTVAIWLVMIAIKVAIGVVEGIAGIASGPTPGEILLFIALSLIVQNLILAYRTIWRAPSSAGDADTYPASEPR